MVGGAAFRLLAHLANHDPHAACRQSCGDRLDVGTRALLCSIFLGPELTVVRIFGNADVTALGATTNIDIAGFVIYPAFALMGEF